MIACPRFPSRRSLATLASLSLLALAAVPALGGTMGAPSRAAVRNASPSGAGPADPLAERLCAALHTLPEERKAQCCTTAPSSTLAQECTRTLSAALRQGALQLDAAAIDRCTADSSSKFAGCDWVTPLVPRSPDSCQGAAQGLAPAGAACASSLECQDGLFCRSRAEAKGVCAPPAPAGSACGGSTDTLATFLRQTDLGRRHPECAGYCLAARCAAHSPLGAACLSSRQCAPGQHCGAGTCREGAFAALGEACTGTSCGADASCQAGKCVALKAEGASCTSPFECKGACLMQAGATTGTCGKKCSNWPLPPTQGETGASWLPVHGATGGPR